MSDVLAQLQPILKMNISQKRVLAVRMAPSKLSHIGLVSNTVPHHQLYDLYSDLNVVEFH